MNEKGESIVSGPSRRFNVIDILTSLMDESKNKDDDGKPDIRPSEYLRQMLLTTDERISLLKSRHKQYLKVNDVSEERNFEIIPSTVVFQQFVPGDTYNVTLMIRNITQVSRYLKTSCELDPFFSVEFRGTCYSTMLAPGLSHLYNVKFIPEERRDYEYRLKFVTNSGEFVVPVIAIGPRGILDFPDRFEIPSTAVKIPSSKTVFVRNVGDAPAPFTIQSANPCFWIEPSKGIINEEDTVQFTVNFLSEKSGDFEAQLILEYESGEKLRIDVQCSAVNCIIRVDRRSIKMEETYLGMSRSKVFTIHNRSDYIVKYQWMRFKESETDKQQREHYKKLFHLIYDMELDRCVDLVHYNICTPDVHQLVCQRIYGDEITSLMNENFRYNHLCFMFTPEEGEIWPQSSMDITVLFRAMEVGEETSTAYLEVTGREDRIPLSLYGVGKGPIFRLNVVTIDLENIYLCSVHNYEVVAANKGHITGTLVHKPKPADFGGTITVTPPHLVLEPDEHKSFNLSFSSNRKGHFVERVDFVIKESLDVLSLHIKGCIVCPTLHFNKESLDFGTTALGFSSRQEVSLHNLSLMPVTFSIAVLNDGDQAALFHEEFARAPTKPSFPSNPREFLVHPEEGVVAAHNSLKIKITYTANIVRSSRTTIQVDMWDSDSDPVVLPIVFCGKVPSLSIKPVEISIRFCFINFPYSRSITVENKSDQDGYFYLVPQTISENTPIIYSLSAHQGLVKAHQSKTINVTIITRELGKQRTTLSMLTMGEKFPLVSCTITCNGQGPVISAQPTSLDFGEVQVLQEKVMKFTVISDAPIPAHFKVTLSKRNSPWSVSPNSVELEPNGSMEIEVKLYLRDVGKYNDNIMLLVVSSRSISVSLTAIGVGWSIIFEPNIFPTFDMGLCFSHQRLDHTLTMKNQSTRHHQIALSNKPELQIQRGQVTTPVDAKFQIRPLMVDIPAGGSIKISCTLLWHTNESLEEDWYVFGQILGQGKRELIGVSSFKVTLTEPQIVFNKKELTFRVDMCCSPSDGNTLHQTDELLVTNQSRLDLNAQLAIRPPFNLLTDGDKRVQKMRIVLIDGTTTKIRVHFSPTLDKYDLYSQTYNDVLWLEYNEHPSKDKIKCKGSLNFPNLTVNPRDVIINCELGSSVEKILTLTNDGPISVTYKFFWIEDSIEIERESYNTYETTLNSPCDAKLESNDVCVQSKLHIGYTNYSDRQDGSGDGPVESITQPVNSPASDECTQSYQSEILHMENNWMMKRSTVSRDDIRDFLSPIIAKYFVDDTELPALECTPSDPSKSDYVNQVMSIEPCEGIVPPYSVQNIHISFDGHETLRIKSTILCKIAGGPAEKINIIARADTIRYSVDQQVVDFGQQLFREPGTKSFTLKNHSTIPFTYQIDSSIAATDGTIDRFDVNPLKIEPDVGLVDAQGSVILDVEHRSTILGPIDHRLKLQVFLKPSRVR